MLFKFLVIIKKKIEVVIKGIGNSVAGDQIMAGHTLRSLTFKSNI